MCAPRVFPETDAVRIEARFKRSQICSPDDRRRVVAALAAQATADDAEMVRLMTGGA